MRRLPDRPRRLAKLVEPSFVAENGGGAVIRFREKKAPVE